MARRPRVGVTGDGRRWAPSWWCLATALRLAGATPERISVRHQASGEALISSAASVLVKLESVGVLRRVSENLVMFVMLGPMLLMKTMNILHSILGAGHLPIRPDMK